MVSHYFSYVLGGFIIAKGEPQLFFCTLYSIGKIKCMTETNISFTQATVSKMVHATSIISFTDNLEPWMKWGYYISPMMYGQNAIAAHEYDYESDNDKIIKNMHV